MKTKATKGFSMIAFLVLPLVAIRASADDAGADAGTDADAGAMAVENDAGADADADAEPPSFDREPFPEEKSAMPKDEEWKGAPQVSLSPRSGGSGCKKQRIREWMRIECENMTAKVTLLGGSAEGVRIKLAPLEDEWSQFPSRGELVFPVRRGDRRVFEWQGVDWGYKGATTATSLFVIQELWLPGDEKPLVVMR